MVMEYIYANYAKFLPIAIDNISPNLYNCMAGHALTLR